MSSVKCGLVSPLICGRAECIAWMVGVDRAHLGCTCLPARYHEMNTEQSLRDNLSYKTLIEYPVLHVVLRDHWEDYPLKEAGKPGAARASC